MRHAISLDIAYYAHSSGTWVLFLTIVSTFFLNIIQYLIFNRSYQKTGLIITGGLLIISIVGTALIVNSYPLSELGLFGGSPDYFLKIYVAPWCRIGPFLIGILLGYLIIKQKETRFRINQVSFFVKYLLFKKLNKLKFYLLFKRLNVVLWIASLFLLGLMLFGIYPNFRGHNLPKFINICYQAMSRYVNLF